MRNYKSSRFGANPPEWYFWLLVAGGALAGGFWLWDLLKGWMGW